MPDRSHGVGPFEFGVERAVRFSLPLTREHEPQLRSLATLSNTVGGAAVHRLVDLVGGSVKDELLGLLVTRADDYNFCANGLGPALQPYAGAGDVETIAQWADSLDDRASESKDSTGGFTNPLALHLGFRESGRSTSSRPRSSTPSIRLSMTRPTSSARPVTTTDSPSSNSPDTPHCGRHRTANPTDAPSLPPWRRCPSIPHRFQVVGRFVVGQRVRQTPENTRRGAGETSPGDVVMPPFGPYRAGSGHRYLERHLGEGRTAVQRAW